MVRLFKQHDVRRVEELHGMWDFYINGNNTLYRIPVPGCFEQNPNLCTYRGKGTYVKTIYVDEPGTVRLEFKGVSHTTEVYFDGVHIAYHYNAFTPYLENGIWNGLLEAIISNTSQQKAKVNVKSILDKYEMRFDCIEVNGESEVKVSLKQQFPDVDSWSHQTPVLYNINTVLYSNEVPIDDLIERVGFRSIKIDGTKILLNGERVFLKGFNRHEDYATIGCAIPLQLMVQYKAQYEQIKSMDLIRPTTSATCKHFKDICLDLPDIVSCNIYAGWYEDVPVEQRKDSELEWISSTEGTGKPIIISEFGAAAIYGYRDRSRCKWSEERQADIIEECLKVYMRDENISGVFIWQFADCRITEEGIFSMTRPRCHNNKGVVDEYRRPKLAYDIVKKLFEEKI